MPLSAKQRGMTAIGWLFTLAVIGVFVLATIRLLPIYMDHYAIDSSLKGIALEPEARDYGRRDILRRISNRMIVSNVDDSDFKNIEVKRLPDGRFKVNWHREPRVHFLANIDFVVVFDYEVTIPAL
jgi:hypothetical protein